MGGETESTGDGVRMVKYNPVISSQIPRFATMRVKLRNGRIILVDNVPWTAGNVASNLQERHEFSKHT